MAIFDNDGTADYALGKLFDNDGTTDYPLGRVYDDDGTVSSLIYTGFEGMLYNAGDQCTDDTGGWVDNAGGTSADCERFITYASGYMELSVDNHDGWDSKIPAEVTTAKGVDVTDFTTMHVQWSYDCSKSGSSKYPYVEFYMGEQSAKPLQPGSSISSGNDHAVKTETIDISSLEGEYKPRLTVFDYYSDTNLVVRIYKVWLT